MSSSGINAVNSGPLVLRVDPSSINNNTYLVGRFDVPLSSNFVLITSSNGVLVPTDSPYVSTVNVSSINGLAYPPPSAISYWNGNLSGNIYNANAGNVGIGTTTPEYSLSVVNKLQVLAGANDTIDQGMATFIRTASTGINITTKDYIVTNDTTNFGATQYTDQRYVYNSSDSHFNSQVWAINMSTNASGIGQRIGDIKFFKDVYADSNLSCASLINVSSINGAVYPPSGGTNYWTLSGSTLYNNSGSSIGIGTTTPEYSLSVVNKLQVLAGVNDTIDQGMATFIRTASTGYIGEYSTIQSKDYIVAGDTSVGEIEGPWIDTRYVYNPYNFSSSKNSVVWAINMSTNASNVGQNIGDIKFFKDVYADSNLSCASLINVSSINGAAYPPGGGGGGGGTNYWTLNGSTISNGNIDGNVAIGPLIFTQNQSTTLTITPTFPTFEAAVRVELDGSNLNIYKSSITGTSNDTFITNNGGDSLVLGTNNPALFINGVNEGNNNIGIGTTTPLTALQIGSDSGLQYYFSTNTVSSIIYGPSVYPCTSTNPYALNLNFANGLFVGTTDTAQQNVGGGISLGGRQLFSGSGNSITPFARVSGVSGSANISGDYTVETLLQTSGTTAALIERMRITSDGNVGIGTSAPEYKLSVANVLQVRASENDTIDQGMATFIRTASTGYIGGNNAIQTKEYIYVSSVNNTPNYVDQRYVYNPYDTNTHKNAAVWGINMSTTASAVGQNIGDIQFYNSVYVDHNLSCSSLSVNGTPYSPPTVISVTLSTPGTTSYTIPGSGQYKCDYILFGGGGGGGGGVYDFTSPGEESAGGGGAGGEFKSGTFFAFGTDIISYTIGANGTGGGSGANGTDGGQSNFTIPWTGTLITAAGGGKGFGGVVIITGNIGGNGGSGAYGGGGGASNSNTGPFTDGKGGTGTIINGVDASASTGGNGGGGGGGGSSVGGGGGGGIGGGVGGSSYGNGANASGFGAGGGGGGSQNGSGGNGGVGCLSLIFTKI